METGLRLFRGVDQRPGRMSDIRYSEAAVTVQVGAIKAEVCRAFNVRPIEMVSHRRARAVARPRQVAMYLARELTPLSLPAIGRHFGNRDHTTVMSALRRVEELAAADADFGARVNDLKHVLGGGLDAGESTQS